MKNWIALVLAAALAFWQLPSQAQARVFNQAELDALLAPVALYPDPVLSNILIAATYPEDLQQAAAWSRANPQLTGENAVRAAEPIPWHPSVKALLAFPELLVRMDESKQWTADLGAAFREQEPYVMDTVQGLRRRAQASGSLQSNDQYSVQQQGSSIAVYPAQPQVVYVPYYDPYVVYGPWWWPAYRPVFWRPWYAHPTVFVSNSVFFVRTVDWHHRHVVRHFPHQQATVQGPHGRQWAQQRANNFHPDRSAAGAAQRAAQAGGQPQQQQHWNQQQQHWNQQQQRWREQQRPEAREPVRPIGQPVRPMSDSVRVPGQPRQTEARREIQTDRRIQAAPPVTIHNQPRAAHPFIESARPMMDVARTQAQPARQFRPAVEAIRPHFEQRGQHGPDGRRAGHQQQRRQAGQPQQRRG